MTKDNASGTGMEIEGVRVMLRSEHERLLAESQAHNAKLEAQVERMREALKLVYDSTAVLNHLPPESLDIICAALKP